MTFTRPSAEVRRPHSIYQISNTITAFIFSVNGFGFTAVWDAGSFGGAKLTRCMAEDIGQISKGRYEYDSDLGETYWGKGKFIRERGGE
jgi:hypothetical protein